MIVLFNKPYGVVSQFSPLGRHATLAKFGLPRGVHVGGRLDLDSEGLLVLSDQADVQRLLTDPKVGHPRVYWAQVERRPEASALDSLRRGVELGDGRTRPCRARLLDPEPQVPPREPPIRDRKTIPTAWVELTLTEGRNRQVRRMTAAVGHPTLRLLRVAIPPFNLEGLEPGQWRQASREEWVELKKELGR